jgi:hypothetical protein
MITGNGQSLAERQWGTGFIPSKYQGVKLRSVGDPVLYVSNPAGFDAEQRARFIENLEQLNKFQFDATQNPEIATRIAQYEMAFRMQTSVPELTDLSKEPEHTFELYGPDSRKPGTYAANCLMARRLAERACVLFSSITAPGIIASCRRQSGRMPAGRSASAGLIQGLKAVCSTTHWSTGRRFGGRVPRASWRPMTTARSQSARSESGWRVVA